MMTEQVQTLGPVDPNAPGRVKAYGALALVFGVVTAAQAFHLLTAEQATGIKDFLTTGADLAGLFGFGFVAFKTHGQVKNGTFDAAPEPEPEPPALSAAEQVKAVGDAFTEFSKTVADGVQLVQGVTANMPGLSAAVDAGSLVERFLTSKTPG